MKHHGKWHQMSQIGSSNKYKEAMDMKYKNPCKFPIPVKGELVQPNEELEAESTEETQRLLKEGKLIEVESTKEETKVEPKKKKGKKNKSSDNDDIAPSEDGKDENNLNEEDDKHGY